MSTGWNDLVGDDSTFQLDHSSPLSDSSEVPDLYADCDQQQQRQEYQASQFFDWSPPPTRISSSYPQPLPTSFMPRTSADMPRSPTDYSHDDATTSSFGGPYSSSSHRSTSNASHDTHSPLEDSSCDHDDRKSRRQKQNRAAQRAFRERRQQQTRVLLERVKELEKANKQLSVDYEEAKRKVESLRDQMDVVQKMMLKYWVPS